MSFVLILLFDILILLFDIAKEFLLLAYYQFTKREDVNQKWTKSIA
jgi:hypothetical protein